MSRKANAAVVGAFVIGGIVLLVAGLVAFGSLRLFRGNARLVVYFEQTVYGLRVGAPVTLKGMPIGSVQEMRIDLSRTRARPEEVLIEVILQIDPRELGTGGEPIELNRETVRGLVRDGLRAEVALESFVTNLRYVALDFQPDTPAKLKGMSDLPEIPSLPTATEELQQRLVAVVENLSRADLAGLVDSLRQLSDSTRALVSSPELARATARLDDLTAHLDVALREMAATARTLGPRGEVGQNLAAASRNAVAITEQGSETAVTLQQLLRPDGAFLANLEQTLVELQRAARSLRQASDQFGRDPGAILRGGEQ